jgi:DNA-binding MarR family transcriptional regulator
MSVSLHETVRPFLAAGHLHPDMTCRQVAILAWIAERPGRSTADVAEALRLTKPVISRATQTLEARGWVFSITDRDDRRKVNLTVLPAGHKALASIMGEPA